MRNDSSNLIPESAFYCRICELLHESAHVRSAVLFGSAASSDYHNLIGAGKESIDFDFHLVTSDPRTLETFDWAKNLSEQGYCFQVSRSATGGVRKLTIICSEGQLDLVLVPLSAARVASLAIRVGLVRYVAVLRRALNEMATCLHSGYSFTKGQEAWEGFYRRVSSLPGVRLSNIDAVRLADGFLVDALWVLQKTKAGELVAAQHILHCKLVDTNLRLWREMRMRKGLRLRSFGLGRRVETIADFDEQRFFSLTKNIYNGDLYLSTFSMLRGIQALMSNLEPQWTVPHAMKRLLDSYQT